MLKGIMGFEAIAARVGLLVTLAVLTCLWTTGCLQRSDPVSANEVALLEIKGEGITKEVRLTLDELKAMQEGLIEDDYFALNSYGSEGYTRFKGVWIWHVLQNSVVLEDDASTIKIIAVDDYQVEFTLDEVKRDDYIDQNQPEKKYKMILAWEEDGREADPEQGNPFQLAVGQKEPGDVNKPYWVRHIKTIIIN
jgi:hypothetical protein